MKEGHNIINYSSFKGEEMGLAKVGREEN